MFQQAPQKQMVYYQYLYDQSNGKDFTRFIADVGGEEPTQQEFSKILSETLISEV